jgi:hypothetical protein
MTVFQHTPPTEFIVFGLLLALVVGAFSFWRFMPRTLGAWLAAGAHLLFLALLGWCLLLPGKRSTETRTLKPRFVVALDTSRSMTLRPNSNALERWAVAQQALALPWVKHVAADCEIDLYTFDTSVGRKLAIGEVAGLAPQGEASLIRDSLRRITSRYGGVNVVGGLVLTDGNDTREAANDWAGEAHPFPLHTLALEGDAVWAVEPDLRVDTVQTPRRVSVDWTTELRALVSGQGTQGKPINVRLFKDGQLLKETPAQIPEDGGSRQVTFELTHPELGVFTYRVEVPTLPGESNTNDNDYALTVEVVDAKNRLIYVEGPPRWESKYLTRALQANRQVTPIIFLQGPGGKPLGLGPVGSMTPDLTDQQLSFFKVVVLGNLDAQELGERRAGSLIKYVEAGGSLVLVGGTEAWGPAGFAASALKNILPARGFRTVPVEGEFPVALTAEGLAHPAFAGDAALWESIPPVLSVFPGAQLTPAARALVTADTPQGRQPIVVSQPYGQGKVVVVLTDSLWKWQLHPHAREARPYQRFWDQLVAWLLPEKEEIEKDRIDLFTDRETLAIGEEVSVSARIGAGTEGAGQPAELRCEIVQPDGTKTPFTLRPEVVTTASGQAYPGYATRYQATQPGMHRVTASALVAGRPVKSDTLSFFVKAFSPETAPRPMDEVVLKGIATASGGRHHTTLDELDETLSALTIKQVDEELSEYHSLWQTAIMLASLMLVAALGWIARKVNNMP